LLLELGLLLREERTDARGAGSTKRKRGLTMEPATQVTPARQSQRGFPVRELLQHLHNGGPEGESL